MDLRRGENSSSWVIASSPGSVAFEEELAGIFPSLESEEEINFVELYIKGKQFKVISLF